MVRRNTSEDLRNFNMFISNEKQETTCFLKLTSIKLGSRGWDTSESRRNRECIG